MDVKTPLGRYLVVLITLCTGVMLSFILFAIVRGWQQSNLEAEFREIAAEHAGIIEDRIGDHVDLLYSLKSLYAASKEVERHEFRVFVEGLFARNPDIIIFDWMPRISHEKRALFEAKARAEGLEDFCIKEMDSEGRLNIASRRAEYFPIHYIEPFEPNKFLLGFDEMSSVDHRDAMEKARDTAKPFATGRIRLIRDPQRGFASRIFMPVYHHVASQATREERRRNLVGFLSILFEVGKVYETALASLPPRGVDVYVYDGPSPSVDGFLFCHESRPRRAKATGRGGGMPPEGILQFRKSFTAGGRVWTFLAVPSPELLVTRKTWQPWYVLFVGLAATLLLGMYIAEILGRESRVRILVAERTEALRNSERIFRSLFNNARDGILLAHGETGQFFMCNNAICEMLGYTHEELTRLAVRDIHPAQSVPDVMEQFDKLMREEIRIAPDLPVKRKDGSVLYVDVSAAPVMLNGKKYLMGLFRDVTQAREAELRLQEALEIKSNFVSMVSHELRTPLTSIKEGIGLVSDEIAGEVNKRQREFLSIARRNVDRLVRLINDVLDFQKLEAGKVEFDMRENNLNDAVREVCATLLPAAQERKLKLSLLLDERLPAIKFDRDGIVQVLTNIIGNAIKFTEAGSVTVSTTLKGNIADVMVQDTGAGIQSKDIPRLFHSFEQLSRGRYRKTGGTGLGLAISKQIIDAHRGKIWVESTPGVGSMFHFVLPLEERRR